MVLLMFIICSYSHGAIVMDVFANCILLIEYVEVFHNKQ